MKKWLTGTVVVVCIGAGAWFLRSRFFGRESLTATGGQRTQSFANWDNIHRAVAEKPSGNLKYDMQNGRIVAHVAPSERPNGRPMTVEDFAVQMQIPGMVSIAGQVPKDPNTYLTEKEQKALEERVRQNSAEVNPEAFIMRQAFKNAKHDLENRSGKRLRGVERRAKLNEVERQTREMLRDQKQERE